MVSCFKKIYGNDEYLTFSNLNMDNLDHWLNALIPFQEALMGKKAIEGVKKIPYFKAFDSIASDIDYSGETEWEHYDLFSFRYTTQKTIERVIESGAKRDDPKLMFYLNESLNRFKSIISKHKFKAIVIVNAYASRILKNELALSWNEEIGTYQYENDMPVFLSGMITGQRALDTGSLERLKWHLRNIAKKKD